MASTPPSGDSPASASGLGQHNRYQNSQDKIRRNVACISCRDSKVRCRASAVAGQPCERCAKLHVPCVYDRTHKRITKKSKLEILEQELKSIREAVNPRASGESSWSPPTPQVTASSLYPEQTNRPDTTATGITNALVNPYPERQPPPARYQQLGPTSSRLLNDKVLPGEDIDWYFEKYLECFHPHLPILRKKIPDECYQACPTLFWTVIFVSSRRYARDETLFQTLVDYLARDVWTLIAAPAHDMETIHTLFLICAWPPPTIRFVTDPSSTLVSIALNSCVLLGLHMGRGSNPSFCVGGRVNMHCTDQEASATWIACCILTQRSSMCAGTPPMFLQHNDNQCKKVMQDVLAPEILMMFDLQKFSNRLLIAMEAQMSAHEGVAESVVKNWEDDFEVLKAVSKRMDTDYSRFVLLATQLEVQSYYFASPPNSPRPNFAFNTIRIFNTSHSLITSALALESQGKLLAHCPHWVYRIIVDASCILLSALHSTSIPPGITPADADAIALQVRSALHSCSVREGDLANRGAVILETFWSVRNVLPKFTEPASAWPERLGSAVTYWCLTRFRDALQEAKKSTEGVNKGLEAFHGPPNSNNPEIQHTVTNGHDLFQEVDWSQFLEEFSWGDGAVFLGPA